jgi:hypothetical protein
LGNAKRNGSPQAILIGQQLLLQGITGSVKPSAKESVIWLYSMAGSTNHPSTKFGKMKLICVVTLLISLSGILSCGDGVATLDPGTGNNAGTLTAAPGNNNTTTTLETKINEPGVNPAHGKPGHRCDIAVGAPLSSNPITSPSTIANPVTSGTPASTNPTGTSRAPLIGPDVQTASNPAAITPSAVPISGLNPRHGQPGHRCDIAVGKPLDSKPLNSNASTPATTTLPSALQNLASPTITPPAASTAASGINPAHGQPGHRCDIAVGKPLNSKPLNSNASTPATTTSPSALPSLVSPTLTSPATSTAAPGMNPAHGQPGHRCDIAVGKPLNSKPAQ